MFAVLQLKKNSKSLKSKVKELLSGPEIDAQRIFYNGEPAFYKITLTSSRKGVPEKEIEDICRKFKGRVLLPQGISLPQDKKTELFRNEEFETVLLFHKMIDTVKAIISDPVKSELCVYDKDALLSREIIRAVPYFSKINIITENRDAYFPVSDIIMERWGLSLTFMTDHNYTNENAVIVCRKGDDVPLFFKGTVFCNRNISAFDCFVVRYTQADLPEDIREILPEGIDFVSFAAALEGVGKR